MYRLDWNLLSTATPAINAWMNPSDRLMTSVRQLVRVLSMRTCSVIACMMTEALDVQKIHVSYKVCMWITLCVCVCVCARFCPPASLCLCLSLSLSLSVAFSVCLCLSLTFLLLCTSFLCNECSCAYLLNKFGNFRDADLRLLVLLFILASTCFYPYEYHMNLCLESCLAGW